MKKIFLSIMALIMVLVSAFSLVGCSKESSTKDVSYEEFIDAYYEAQTNVAKNFVYEDGFVVDVYEDFTFSIEKNGKSECFKYLTFKETEDGEYVTKKIQNSTTEYEEKISISIKKIDGVVFITATIEMIEQIQEVDVAESGLLENTYNNLEVTTTWYMGKNDEGYYIAKHANCSEDNNGTVNPITATNEYMYYDDESAYKASVSVFLDDLYNSVSDLFITETIAGFVELKKNGNKLSYKVVNDYIYAGNDYGSFLELEINNYELENAENLSLTNIVDCMYDMLNEEINEKISFTKGAKVIIIESFDGYDNAELSLDSVRY